MTKWSLDFFTRLTIGNISQGVLLCQKTFSALTLPNLNSMSCFFLKTNRVSKEFDNSPKGFKLLQRWLESLQIIQVHAPLEATGIYGAAVANFLHRQGHLVSVVNPLSIKGYAKSKMQRNKTDKTDARPIANFCLTQNPTRWFPPKPETIELQALIGRIESLEEMLQMEKNQLDVSPNKTKSSIKRMIKTFENEIKTLRKSIKKHIDDNPNLKEQDKLLQTMGWDWRKNSRSFARRD